MKITMRSVLFTLLLLILVTPSVTAAPTVQLDGRQLTFDVPPIIENGRTLVPLRAIFEAMGAKVVWDEANYTAKAAKGNTIVIIPIGSTTPTVNGKITQLDVPAKIVNGRTLAPLRFVGEAFGGQVNWDAKTQNITMMSSGNPGYAGSVQNIVFLHHSTGECIWEAGVAGLLNKIDKSYKITDVYFPKSSPYGWNNYPFDYYNIWVKNAGDQPFKEEPTLEILTRQYNVIIFKHCYPVSRIEADQKNPDIGSDTKTLANYKLQYQALKKKMNEFPETKFILWTPTALVEKSTNKEQAQRADEFTNWVKNVWDTPNDNIFLWDFRALQTENGLYFKTSYAASATDSHPNSEFSKRVAPYFCTRVVDVIRGNGDKTSVTGK